MGLRYTFRDLSWNSWRPRQEDYYSFDDMVFLVFTLFMKRQLATGIDRNDDRRRRRARTTERKKKANSHY